MMELWRREVARRRQDIVPNEERLRRLLAGFDWDTRSRVVENGAGITGSVLVTIRPSPEGALANLYAAGDGDVYADMVRWGVQFSRAAGAAIVQVYAGQGTADGLARAGLARVRPWWRMDRRLGGELPAVGAPVGYELVDGTSTPAERWVDLFNRTFADHWRFAPRGQDEITGGKAPELCLMAVRSTNHEAAGMALGELEDYGDARAQPVGLIGSVGTLPEDRRRGLARWIVAELMRRLRAAGARSASLYVDGMNPLRAANVYRKLGFEVAFVSEVWEATTSR